MKKRIIGFVSAAVMAVTCISSNITAPYTAKAAYSTEDEDYELRHNDDWTWYNCKDHVRITVYRGAYEDLYIPELLDDLPVTEIDNNTVAYECPEKVRTLHVPAFITDLGILPGSLPNLEKVDISEANKSFIVENNAVYTADKTKLIRCLTCAEGEFTVPDTVAVVETDAFRNCRKLTGISIPASVKELKSIDFRDCTSLESIDVDENNTVYSSVDGVLLDKAKEKLYKYPVSSSSIAFSIPDGVKEIGKRSFENADALESAEIPDSVGIIGEEAFINCGRLNNVVIPDSVAEIRNSAFKGCTSLSKITFSPETYKYGYDVVEGTPWFGSQPDGAVYTGSVLYRFKGTLATESTLVVKDGTVGINEHAFVNNIGEMMSGVSSLVSVTLPDGIKYIDESAFYGCDNLKEINLPDSIESIDKGAFFGCYSLNKVHIPASMEVLKDDTFSYCHSLEEIVIPPNIKRIEKGALSDCRQLKSITVENPFCIIEDMLWYERPLGVEWKYTGEMCGCSGSQLQSYAERIGCNFVPIDDKNSSVSENAETDKNWKWTKYKDHVRLEEYYGDSEILEIPAVIGDLPVTELSYYIDIKNAGKIKSIRIPAGVAELGSLLTKLENISDIEIDKDNKYYISEDNAVYSADKTYLIRCSTDKINEEFSIPETVAEVNECAFINCSGLKTLNIPASTTYFNCYFDGCVSLEAINVSKDNQNYKSKDGILFNRYCTSILRYPPKHSGNTYTVPFNVSDINDQAFMECDGLESVYICNGITTLSFDAFKGCDKLDNVVLPETVQEIYSSAFENCSNLKSIKFSDDIKRFGEDVLKGTPWLEAQNDGPVYCGPVFCTIKGDNSDLTEITVKDGTKCIADYAFSVEKDGKRGNASLKKVILPESTEYLGDAAFFGCSALKTVDFCGGIKRYNGRTFSGCSSLEDIILFDTTIMRGDFESCGSLKNVVVPENVSVIEMGAFADCASLASVTVMNPGCEILGGPCTFCNSYTESRYGKADKQVKYSGTICGYNGSTAEVYAKANGYKFVTLGKAPEDFICGDINDNGIVDAVDASMTLGCYTMLSTTGDGGFNAGQKYAADVNRDGIIDAVDASKILSYYAYSSTVKGGAVPLREYLTGVKVLKGFEAEGNITSISPGANDTVVVQYTDRFTVSCCVFDPVSDKTVRKLRIPSRYQTVLGMLSNGTIVTSQTVDPTGNEMILMYPEGSDEPVRVGEIRSGSSGTCLDMENNCLYWIDDDENCLMKLNDKGEISRHLSLENYSGCYWDINDRRLMIASDNSHKDAQGINTGLYSPEDGKEVIELPYSFNNILITRENFTFAVTDWESRDTILQTGSIGGKKVEKAYRFRAEPREFMSFRSDHRSDYVLVNTSDYIRCRKLMLADVKNGTAANVELDISASLSDNNCCYFGKNGQWIVGMNSTDNENPKGCIIMIDPEKQHFTALLENTDVQEYKLKEPASIGEALKEIREEADKIGQKFGVTILVGNDVKTAETNTGYIFGSVEENADDFQFTYEMEKIKMLGKLLAMYPEGFFDSFRLSSGSCGLRISVVKDLKTDRYSDFVASGIAYTTGDWFDIAICSKDIYDTSTSLHHEMWHSVENLIEAKLGEIDHDEWAKLNPVGYEYPYDFDGYWEKADNDISTPTYYNAAVSGETRYDFPYFISDYSMVTPMEDRATLIAQLFLWEYDVKTDRMCLTDEDELKKYPHIRAKLECLERYSQQLFGYVYWHKMLENMEKTRTN